MRIVTNIDIPDYVYTFFAKQARLFPHKTAEELMADCLARHVHQKLDPQCKENEAK